MFQIKKAKIPRTAITELGIFSFVVPIFIRRSSTIYLLQGCDLFAERNKVDDTDKDHPTDDVADSDND